MYAMLRRYLIFLLLSVSLLLSLGMYEKGERGPVNETAATADHDPQRPQAPAAGEPLYRTIRLKAESASPQPAGPEPVGALPAGADPAAPNPQQSSEYITTAYFLNVRSAPTSKSDILRVVEKDTILQVKGETGNGWLQLADEGYVHGDYAMPIIKPEPVSYAAAMQVRMTKTMAAPETENESQTEPVPPSSKVQSDSGLTVRQIEEILEGTGLAGHQLEEAILEIEDQHGINAYFTIAVMKLESGNGESRLAARKNNLFGLNASGKNPYENAFRFETKAESVRKFGQLISEKYVDKGFTTVEKVARKYCPANSKWPALVKTIMKRDHNLL